MLGMVNRQQSASLVVYTTNAQRCDSSIEIPSNVLVKQPLHVRLYFALLFARSCFATLTWRASRLCSACVLQ